MKRAVFLLLTASPLLGSASADNWPQLGRTPQHTSYVKEGPKMPFEMMWRLGFGERITYAVQPVIAEGKVYLGTKSGSLFAVDAAGAEYRRILKAGPILATVAYHKGIVFCTSLDGYIYGINADSGELAFKHDTGFGISAAPLVAEDKVFAVNREGKMVALDAATGSFIWETELGAPCLMSPAWDKGRVFLGTEDMYFHAVSAKDGSKLWRSEKLYGTSFLDGHPVVHKDRIVVNTLFREVCGNAHEVQPYKTDFGPWWWSGATPKTKELKKQIEEKKELPQSLIAEQDKIIEYYRANPQFMSTFVFEADTGKQPYIVGNFRDGGNGLNPMPALAPDGNLIMQFHIHGTGIGKFDITKGKFIDAIIPKSFGNNDEPHAFAVAGDIVYAIHQEISHQQASSFFNLTTRKRIGDGWAREADNLRDTKVIGWSPYQLKYRGYTSFGCLLKHGTSAAIAGSRFYVVRENWLDAFEGAPQTESSN